MGWLLLFCGFLAGLFVLGFRLNCLVCVCFSCLIGVLRLDLILFIGDLFVGWAFVVYVLFDCCSLLA